jgi:hypothetical protein
MKRVALGIAAVAAAALTAAGTAPATTNVPAIFTVKVKIYDGRIAMSPNHAVRGSTITFVMINRGKKTHTFVIGDVKRGAGFGSGFKQVLKPNQQFSKVMFLDFRGTMRFYSRVGTMVVARGAFTIR